MNFEELFRRLGCPKHTEKVYTDLLTHPVSTPTEIETRAKLHRPVVYRTLSSLLELNLISETKEGKRSVYSARGPQSIKRAFLDVYADVNTAIEQKFSGYVSEEKDQDVLGAVQVFSGPDAVTKVYEDIIAHTKKGETWYRYTSEQDLDFVNSLLPKGYRKDRDHKKLERKVISNRSSASQKKPRLERFIKIIDQDHTGAGFDQNFIQLVYGSKLAFIDLNKMHAFVISNKNLAEFQKVIFRKLYKKL